MTFIHFMSHNYYFCKKTIALWKKKRRKNGQ